VFHVNKDKLIKDQHSSSCEGTLYSERNPTKILKHDTISAKMNGHRLKIHATEKTLKIILPCKDFWKNDE
jgi:hypothetical protein